MAWLVHNRTKRLLWSAAMQAVWSEYYLFLPNVPGSNRQVAVAKGALFACLPSTGCGIGFGDVACLLKWTFLKTSTSFFIQKLSGEVRGRHRINFFQENIYTRNSREALKRTRMKFTEYILNHVRLT